MPRFSFTTWTGALCTLGVLAGCGGPAPSQKTAANRDQPPAAAVAESPVELQVLDYDGLQQLIAGHKGKVVVMDAWSTSCPPCIKEFPNLVALQKKHPDRLAAISLSFDNEGVDALPVVKQRVTEFLTSQGATFDNVLSREETDDLYEKMKLAAVPAVFVYDPGGDLVKRFEGTFTYEDVGELVEGLLK